METNPNSAKIHFPEMEESVLAFWNQENIFAKSLEMTSKGMPYIFYDGPPFATGLPHHGHLVASTIKDIIPRYFTMKGRYVSRRFGWDCHGLPIEQQIDEKYGMSAADFVAEHGIAKYNAECRSIVSTYAAQWEKTIGRLGRFVDFKNDYKTMDTPFMESVWWVFKRAYDLGLIYRGVKVVPYSYQLETAISNFEAGQNYRTVQDPSLTVKFALEDDPDHGKICVWTTTPWTLPANLGLCVSSKIQYLKVEHTETKEILILAKERLPFYLSKKIPLRTLSEFSGDQLRGKSYTPLFPFYQHLKPNGAFQIFCDDYVTTSDGTGVVHLAPSFGQDDFRIFQEHKLLPPGSPLLLDPIDSLARYKDEIADFKGEFVKDADKKIIKQLKDHQKVLFADVIEHSYPFCPRTDTPLINRAMPQWFLQVEKIKTQMLSSNDQIYWVPGHIKEGRFGKWLEGAKDWAISRNRYWGTPLPLWQNDVSEKYICIGSIAELSQYTGVTLTDLHRDHVDQLTFTLPGEKGTYRRINEVLDCWFESGAMPYAQLHYPFENKELFENNFPAEFIAEGQDQTRGWFYTLTVLSTLLYQKPAFKNVIVNGMVLASDGRKMSKRLKNYTAPDVLMDTYGADALRLYLITSGVVKSEELKFSDEGVKDMARRALLPWYNAFYFYQTYQKIDGYQPTLISELSSNLPDLPNLFDQWIITRIIGLIKIVDTEMQAYRLYHVVPALFDFIDDLTNWYIRLNRRRFWSDVNNPQEKPSKEQAYNTLYTALYNLSALLAPFAPYLADYIYRGIKSPSDPESIHLCQFPTLGQHQTFSEAEELELKFHYFQEIISLGRMLRLKSQIKTKTPLKELILYLDDEKSKLMAPLLPYIQGELNVKTITFQKDMSSAVTYQIKPNLPLLGKKLGPEIKALRDYLGQLNQSQLSQLESTQTIQFKHFQLSGEEVLIEKIPLHPQSTACGKMTVIQLDLTVDEDQINEGNIRELIHLIQNTRKESNLNVLDRIELYFQVPSELQSILQQASAVIAEETLCTDFHYSPQCHPGEAVIPFDFFSQAGSFVLKKK